MGRLPASKVRSPPPLNCQSRNLFLDRADYLLRPAEYPPALGTWNSSPGINRGLLFKSPCLLNANTRIEAWQCGYLNFTANRPGWRVKFLIDFPALAPNRLNPRVPTMTGVPTMTSQNGPVTRRLGLTSKIGDHRSTENSEDPFLKGVGVRNDWQRLLA